MQLIFECISICSREVHPLKAFFPIKVTEDGIVICVSDLHFSKELSPIDFKDDGSIISENDEQFEKQLLPIVVTEFANSILILILEDIFNFLINGKSEKLMFSIDEKIIVISSSDEQLERKSNFIDFKENGIVILLRDVHPLKILLPIVFKDNGNFISDNDEQFKKQLFPNDTTEDGISICLSDVQSLKASFSIIVTHGGIEICVSEEHP